MKTQTGALPPLHLLAARALPLAALILFTWLLVRHLRALDLAQVQSAVVAVTPLQWLGAGLATAVSFAAVGQYDAVLHTVMRTGVSPRDGRRAGVRAIALAQTLGFGSLTGALVRWRCLPQMDLWAATRLSVLVSLSFLAAWAVVTTVVVNLTGHGLDLHPAVPLGALAATAGVGALLALGNTAVARNWRLRRRVDGLTGAASLRLLGWTVVDTAFAALALGILLPPDLLPDPATLFAAYLLALGAGLLSNAPGGVGAFELTLLALLPGIGAEPLLAAILAFRVVYYVVPALIGLATLVRPVERFADPLLSEATGPVAAAPAEWGLRRQGASCLVDRGGRFGWLARTLPGHLIGIGPPMRHALPCDLAAVARSQGRRPALYKCDQRSAAWARRAGWHVLAISQEAVIHLDSWTLDLPARRGLRRKLRNAAKAGLRIVTDPGVLPITAMTRIATVWAHDQGGERGFSMGRFDPVTLGDQAVVLGYVGDRLVGYVTFHRGAQDSSLDLLRHDKDMPDGTMHALVTAAIDAARGHSCLTLSLAAVPLGRAGQPPQGLAQFKGAFAPRWQPRYHAAPGTWGLVSSLIWVTLAIHRPCWLAPILRNRGLTDRPARLSAENAFETPLHTCEAVGQDFHPGTAPIVAAPTLTRPIHDRRPQLERSFPPS